MNMYVGNLSYSVTEDELRSMFTEYGDVVSAKLIMDRETGRSKGFGFVEMSNNSEAQKAMEDLNGNTVDGRALTVNQARPREDRSRGGGAAPGAHRRGPAGPPGRRAGRPARRRRERRDGAAADQVDRFLLRRFQLIPKERAGRQDHATPGCNHAETHRG